MASPILVTGGTGTLGRHVVRRLLLADRDIRVLSRHRHTSENSIEYVTSDLLKGDGIEPAVDGAKIILHCAGNDKGNEEATGNLVRAATRAGAQRVRAPLDSAWAELDGDEIVLDLGRDVLDQLHLTSSRCRRL